MNIISHRTAMGRSVSERHELFIIMQKREKYASFLPRASSPVTRWKLGKYVMIGKEMCQSGGDSPETAERGGIDDENSCKIKIRN